MTRHKNESELNFGNDKLFKVTPGVLIMFPQDRTVLNCICFCLAFWLLRIYQPLISCQCSEAPLEVAFTVASLSPLPLKSSPLAWQLSCWGPSLLTPWESLYCSTCWSLFPGSLLSSSILLFHKAPFPVVTWKTVRGRLIFCSLTWLRVLRTPWHSSLGRWLNYGNNYSEVGSHHTIVS